MAAKATGLSHTSVFLLSPIPAQSFAKTSSKDRGKECCWLNFKLSAVAILVRASWKPFEIRRWKQTEIAKKE